MSVLLVAEKLTNKLINKTMKKNEIIELLKPKCNGYDLPLSLNIELIAELLVNKQEEAIKNTLCCTELVCDLCKGSGWNDRYTTPEECHICQGTGKAK